MSDDLTPIASYPRTHETLPDCIQNNPQTSEEKRLVWKHNQQKRRLEFIHHDDSFEPLRTWKHKK